MNTELTALLRKARGYVERGWTREVGARNTLGMETSSTNRYAIRWCTIGAMERANAGPGEMVSHGRALLLSLIPDISLAGWNDAPGRTQQDVLNLFDRAIEKAENAK